MANVLRECFQASSLPWGHGGEVFLGDFLEISWRFLGGFWGSLLCLR